MEGNAGGIESYQGRRDIISKIFCKHVHNPDIRTKCDLDILKTFEQYFDLIFCRYRNSTLCFGLSQSPLKWREIRGGEENNTK